VSSIVYHAISFRDDALSNQNALWLRKHTIDYRLDVEMGIKPTKKYDWL
jgi:hypothetical protein